ncbi:MAG: hypothetical protein EXQ94_05705 [Alphaproteobacteria bacterium]|nr:hypothetical protein [Alphaproteobacteria bacterium]
MAIERDYRDPTVPYREILERHGITNHRFYAYADRHGWPRRKPRELPPPRPGYELRRLAQALRARLVTAMDDGSVAPTERCVALLLKLVQAHEKMMGIERATKPARKESKPDPLPTRAEQDEIDRANIERYVEARIQQRLRQMRGETD